MVSVLFDVDLGNEKMGREREREGGEEDGDTLSMLREECACLRRIIYYNLRQHRRHKTMGRLNALKRNVELLLDAEDMKDVTDSNKNEASQSFHKSKKSASAGSAESVKILVHLLARARFIVNEIDVAALSAAADLAGMLSRTLYVPFALAASASVARIHG